MKFRLDAQHYINDRLLEPGHIIGDGTDVPMILANGEDLKPSVQMTPLDGEAQSLFKRTFPGAKLPERDPMKNIPIHPKADGTVPQPGGPVETVDNVPGGYVIGPDGKPTNELKKGLPDSGSPNHPVGQPIIGHVSDPGTTPHVPAKTPDPALAVVGSQTQEQKDQAAAAAAKQQAANNQPNKK